MIQGFLIDSWYIKDKGVVLLVQVKSGAIKKGDSIASCGFNQRYEVFEVECFITKGRYPKPRVQAS